MTDNEIIKALECCKSRECPECSRLHNALTEECECRLDLMEKVYDLINRQKADLIEKDKQLTETLKNSAVSKTKVIDYEKEINRQKAEIEKLQKECEITRAYIHENNLEYDLLAYSKRRSE